MHFTQHKCMELDKAMSYSFLKSSIPLAATVD